MSENNDAILTLLNLPADTDIKVSKVETVDGIKHIYLGRDPYVVFCPICSKRMLSKGLYKRTVNHPIFQDFHNCILHVDQRRWRCPNCGYSCNESFPFLQKGKQYTTITPLLVLNTMKDLNRSTSSVARQFNMSDTEVHDLFSQYVDLKRLPLPEYISVDEVYLHIKPDSLYAFVIMDFQTCQIIDIVHNRWKNTLEEYFFSISREERCNVKGVITDAYGPYQDLSNKFFPNAVGILDSFHVVSYILNKITIFINSLLRKERDKQRKELAKKNFETNRDFESIKDSQEIILLRNYRWVVLKNQDEINYSYMPHYHKRLDQWLTTYQIEDMFFNLNGRLKKMRDLKEKYIAFNSASYDDVQDIRTQLDKIIDEYRNSGLAEFVDVSYYLKAYYENIIRSFTITVVSRKSKKDQLDYYSRLSNGPMESFNRKPKDFKRITRGSSNFDYTRNRILWATRIDPSILAVPKALDEIHSYHLDPSILRKRRANLKKKKLSQ